jgi:hypothetical protein
MKKYLLLLLTFVAATGISLAFRHALHGPATASVRNDEPRAEPFTPSAARPTNLDKPVRSDDASGLRFAAVSAKSADAAELLLARLAHDSGAYLLARAQADPGNTRLLQQAAAHFRACLTHEGAGNAGTLFTDARSKLELSERLLAAARRAPANKSAEQPKVVASPAPAPAPAPLPVPPAAPRPTGQTVGPEGIIYERTGEAQP